MIKGEKLVEKKYGIKNRGLIHFKDGIFKKNDSFEIGQVVRLGNKTVQITSRESPRERYTTGQRQLQDKFLPL